MSEYETGRCVIGEREHGATVGYVCDHHLAELGKMLRTIEHEAAQLEIRPSMAVAYDTTHSGLASEQSPVRLVPAVLRDRRRGTGMTVWSEDDEIAWDETPSALETLHSRARLVREERDLAVPTTVVYLGRDTRPADLAGPVCGRLCWHDSCGPWVTDTVTAEATLSSERDLLTRQLLWICDQPWVDEFYTELRQLLTALRRANGTHETHVGTCGTLQSSGYLCDGKVWHVLIKADGKIDSAHGKPDPEDEPGFRCATCRRVWTGTEAVRKRHAMWLDEQERKATA